MLKLSFRFYRSPQGILRLIKFALLLLLLGLHYLEPGFEGQMGLDDKYFTFHISWCIVASLIGGSAHVIVNDCLKENYVDAVLAGSSTGILVVPLFYTLNSSITAYNENGNYRTFVLFFTLYLILFLCTFADAGISWINSVFTLIGKSDKSPCLGVSRPDSPIFWHLHHHPTQSTREEIPLENLHSSPETSAPNSPHQVHESQEHESSLNGNFHINFHNTVCSTCQKYSTGLPKPGQTTDKATQTSPHLPTRPPPKLATLASEQVPVQAKIVCDPLPPQLTATSELSPRRPTRVPSQTAALPSLSSAMPKVVYSGYCQSLSNKNYPSATQTPPKMRPTTSAEVTPPRPKRTSCKVRFSVRADTFGRNILSRGDITPPRISSRKTLSYQVSPPRNSSKSYNIAGWITPPRVTYALPEYIPYGTHITPTKLVLATPPQFPHQVTPPRKVPAPLRPTQVMDNPLPLKVTPPRTFTPPIIVITPPDSSPSHTTTSWGTSLAVETTAVSLTAIPEAKINPEVYSIQHSYTQDSSPSQETSPASLTVPAPELSPTLDIVQQIYTQYSGQDPIASSSLDPQTRTSDPSRKDLDISKK